MRRRLNFLAALRPSRTAPTAAARRVRVFCNNDRDILDGYQPEAHLVLAYTLTAPTACSDSQILEWVFAMFNDHPLDADDETHTRAWYDSGLRSLSVGDVVAIDDNFYACASIGWIPIEPR
ncbi:hypothetical protein ACFWPH_33705 [Nocardia sp. NPDC058499]|uniref:hypothetical protein n=1 Tax=Nocardia sp. NPDC058499 TaxID=3346530 RepID=UPI003666FED6